jgi:ribosomal protein S27AE
VPRAVELADDDRPRSALGELGARSEELRALPAGEYKVVENRLRRMADRQSLQLVKSRRRDRRAPDHGKYMLVDRSSTAVPAGGDWSLDLGEVEQILLGTDPAARRLYARNCPKCGAQTHSLSGLVAGALVDDRECPDCGHSFIADGAIQPHTSM